MELELSLKFDCVGKPTKRELDKKWLNHLGNVISLGWGFQTVSLPIEDIWQALTIDGFPIGPALLPECRTNRHTKFFKSHQIALVDIDNGMTIEQLFNDDFYNAYGLGFYTSPSHTEEAHRFRIAFLLENPITLESDMKHLYTGLMGLYSSADDSCKDGVRLFFGTPNCEINEFNPNKILPQDIIESLIVIGKENSSKKKPNEDTTGDDTRDVRNIKKLPKEFEQYRDVRILELLRDTYIGKYPIWRDIGWGLKDGGYSLSDFEYVTIGGLMNSKDETDCKIVWDGFKPGESNIGMGSVFYYLKQYGKLEKNVYKNVKRINRLANVIEKLQK
jgi:hypothetical protein